MPSFQRTYGYFQKGTRRPSYLGHFIRKRKVSVLASVDMQSVIGYSVIEGSFNTELFNFMFQSMILPRVGSIADKEPRSVVILDNCRIHDSDEFIDMVRNKDGTVSFLPPYSPDFNPVEFLFRSMKAWLKRHLDYTFQEPKNALVDALEASSEQASSFFALSEYI